MLKKLFFVACNLLGLISFAQVGINTTTPNAQLDIRATSATTPSNTDGLLIPKINVFPVTNPTAAQQGMLVYLTTAVGTKQPGFYYWDNPTLSWIGIGVDAKAWQLAGNFVNATTDFMGSTNDADVIFKRNNVRVGRLGDTNTSFGKSALNPATTGLINTAIGHQSLFSNTSGNYNVAIGNDALKANLTGNDNLALGSGALMNNTSGNGNAAFGNDALYNNNANDNIGIGRKAMFNTTNGTNNLAVGYQALFSNTTGSNNTGIGFNTQTGNATTVLTNATALGANAFVATSNSMVLGSINGVNGSTASVNVGIGTTTPNAALEVKAVSPAGPTNTEGLLIPRMSVFPTANPTAAQHGMMVFLTTTIGTRRPGFYYWNNPATSWIGLSKDATAWQLAGNTVNATIDFMGSTNDADVIFKRFNLRAGHIGASSTSFGVKALNPASTGLYNNAIGLTALSVNTTGERNNAMGFEALLDNTTGRLNTALGDGSLFKNISGNNNSAVGYNSLLVNTTGNNNSALGYAAFSTGAMYSNSTALGANTNITASNQVRLGDNAITSIGGRVGWTTLSDARFKTENAKKVPGIDFIKKLRPVTYYVDHEAMNVYLKVSKGKDGAERTSTNGQNTYKPEYVKSLESGFMAQEVEQAAKELGYEFNGVDAPKNEKDYYGLRYSQFVVPLVKAVQELNEKVEQKQIENDQLKAMLLELEKRIAKLEKNTSN